MLNLVNAKKITKGFSLIESLISLSLFFFIFISSLEFFLSTRTHFYNLKEEQETNLAAYATLDRIRLDICESGRGLLTPQSFGLLEAIQISGDSLIIQSKDRDIITDNDLVTGQTFLPLNSTTGIKKGQEICFCDQEKGELNTIISIERHGIVLATPMIFSYSNEAVKVILIRTVSLYFDKTGEVLRRKVNTSPAQPLLEEVASFGFDYNSESKIVSLCLSLATKEEKKYEISVFSKNMALVTAP